MNTSTFIQSDKTKKFVKQIQTLINTGDVRNYAEIVKALDWNKSILSSVVNGNKNVPNDVYRKFLSVYQIEDLQTIDNPVKMNSDENTTSLHYLIKSNAELVTTNSKLADMLERSMANSSTQQHVSVTLEPLLHRLAVAGVGKFWKDYDAGRIELNKLVFSTLEVDVKSGKSGSLRS